MSSTTFQDFQTPILASWLNDVDASTYQGQLDDGTTRAAIDKYTPAGTGAITTSVQTQLRRTVFVDNFRAVVDSDDTEAFQRAFVALGTSPGTVEMTPGTTYTISGTVPCYAGQNLIGYGAILNVANSNTVFLSYNVADTFNFLNYYPPTTIAGFKVLGKVGTTIGTINPNFVLAKINRTPYVNMRDINLYYASAAWVLGESILCSFTNVNCYNPISTSFSFVLGSGGFGPNACTLFNCEIEEQKYPCTGVFVSSGNINVDTCYLESLSTAVYLNGGSAIINNTAMGVRWQTNATAILVDSPCSLSVLNSTITFAGRLSTPISQGGLNINAATFLEFNGNIVSATHDSTDTSICFAFKAAVKGTINDNQFLRNSNGATTTLFSCGAGAIQMFLGTFSDNYLSADAGSTIVFNETNATGSWISATATDNFMLRVTNFVQITNSNFIDNYYPGSDKPPLPVISSAVTMTVGYPIAMISGTTAISTLNGSFNQITLIPTGLWATNTAGNIALASTAVVGKALIMTYDATTAKWYPSY